MKKILISLGIAALILLGATYDAKATECLYGYQGGTGLCTASSSNIGQVPVVGSILSGTPVWIYGNASGTGGGGSVTINQLTTSTYSIQAGSGATVTSSTGAGGQGIITIAASGNGSSTSLYQGYGITLSPSPITVSGTVAVATGTLNGLYYQIVNNLSELTSTSTARTNLGLGSIATHPSTDYLASSTTYVASFNTRTGAVTLSSGDVTTALGYTPLSTSTGLTTANFSSANISQWTNNSGYITTSTFNSTGTANALTQWNGSGNALSSYAGSSCTVGSLVTSVSAAGAVSCVTTSTILTGYATSTGANPSASITGSAINGSANTFMRSDAAPGFASTVNGTNANWSGNHSVSGTATFGSTLTQSGGVVSLASTTINGNATTTNLSITSVSGTQCLHSISGVISGTGSDCGSGGGGGSATTTINLASGPTFNFTIANTSGAPSITTSTSGGSSTIAFFIPGGVATLSSEIASGTVNGSNTSFTVKNVPVFVEVSGQVMVSSSTDANNYGYSVSGSSAPYTLTFVSPPLQNPHSFYTSTGSTTPVDIPWTIANDTAGNIDVLHVFASSSTIKSIWAVQEASGTEQFMLGLATSTANPTSTLRYLFTGTSSTVAQQTSTQITLNGSSTANTGDILEIYTLGNTSSTEFHVDISYTSP